MAYISKKDILAAYKKLSEMHPDPNAQGATQKVSAIRHFLALDRFYKLHNRDCNTRDKRDKDEFCKLVGIVSDVCLDLYTTNFYYPLKQHNGDFSVGSNFYSAGQVSASLVNPQGIFDYPKRGGNPLLKIQNGVLIRDVALYENFKSYISSSEYAVALTVWMIRKINVEQNNGLSVYQNIYNAISQIFTSELMFVLFDEHENFESLLKEYDLSFDDNFYSIEEDDVKSMFDLISISASEEYNSRQIIFYGAPGTGKSHEVKMITGELEAEKDGVELDNVFRTTFHPDTDYATFVGCYKPTMRGTGQVRIVDGKTEKVEEISYEFVPQTFTDAYVYAYQHPDTVTYLVIEEINRGNCAQVFGDLFQLLDRKEDGTSEYRIKADTDLAKHLIKEGVASGDAKDVKLCLPKNLHILATMNTSDQSLFPMDSAFKRRWDWEYVPINYNNVDWEIVLDEENKYKWTDFQHAVNDKLKDVATGEDKMLGDYFVNASATKVITAKMLLNKILFYLWSDVCKDGEGEIFRLQTGEADQKTEDVKFSDLFLSSGESDIEKLKQLMAALEVNRIQEEIPNT